MRRLHLTIRVTDPNRATITARRLWGEWNAPSPVIRVALDVPPAQWWAMRMIAIEAYEMPVSETWEVLTGRERYEQVRDYVVGKVAARCGLPDRHEDGRRKQRKRV